MKTTSWVLVILIATASIAKAETYRINASEIYRLTNLLPGDSVIIASGVYYDTKISFIASGTYSKPITLSAEEAGKVIFTGESYLHLKGRNLVVENLWFKDLKPLPSVSPIEIRTDSSIVRNCLISGFNTDPNDSTDNKWVSIYGKNNVVEKCSFYEKKNIGCLLVVWLEKDVLPNHKILSNYFFRPTVLRDKGGSKRNGQECVRIGTSHFSMQDAGCIVSNNTFL